MTDKLLFEDFDLCAMSTGLCCVYIGTGTKIRVYEVYADPHVVLVAVQWYTAPAYESRERIHIGFNFYIGYDCPCV